MASLLSVRGHTISEWYYYYKAWAILIICRWLAYFWDRKKLAKRAAAVSAQCGGREQSARTLFKFDVMVQAGRGGNVIGRGIYNYIRRWRAGSPAPDGIVHRLDSLEPVLLSSFFRPGRWTVLNFGSYTWPPFRAHIPDLKRIADEFAADVDVVTVYVIEAHPADEWDLNDGFDEGSSCILQPRTLAQRQNAAKAFAERYDYPAGSLVLDNMQNSINDAYGAEPERLYCVKDGKLAYCGGFGPYHYDPEELREFLVAAVGSSKKAQ